MPHTPSVVLCRYHYDALDRLAGRSAAGQVDGHCFYQKSRLATETQGQVQYSWLQTPQQLLAQQRCTASLGEVALIGTDVQGSVLHGLDAGGRHGYAYSAYGHRHPAVEPPYLPGFNRQRAEPVTGHYLLGNGYRAFNPALMRFNSPDNESPFGRGGLNAYAYCGGDPVSRTDPDGHKYVQLWKSVSKRALYEHKATTPISNEVKVELLNAAADRELRRVTPLPKSTGTLQDRAFAALSRDQLDSYDKNGRIYQGIRNKLKYVTSEENATNNFPEFMKYASREERFSFFFPGGGRMMASTYAKLPWAAKNLVLHDTRVRFQFLGTAGMGAGGRPSRSFEGFGAVASAREVRRQLVSHYEAGRKEYGDDWKDGRR